MDQLITDALPSGERQRYVPIVRCPPMVTVVYPVLSSTVLRIPVHWCQEIGDKGRLLPHTLPRERCYGCCAGKGTRVNGYLGVWLHQVARIGVLELTEEALRLCRELWEEPNVDLYGRELRVWRDGKLYNSPVRCRLDGACQHMPDGRLTVDVLAAVTRLWGSVPLVPRTDRHDGPGS
jgi:hypothetical protein